MVSKNTLKIQERNQTSPWNKHCQQEAQLDRKWTPRPLNFKTYRLTTQRCSATQPQRFKLIITSTLTANKLVKQRLMHKLKARL